MEEDFDAGGSAISSLTDAILSLISTTKELDDAKKNEAAEAKKKSEAERKEREQKAKLNKTVDQAADSLIKLGKELNAIAVAGMKLSSTIGTDITRGVKTELNNRTSIFKSIFTTEKERMSSYEDVVAAESSFANAFSGAAEGMQISSDGVTAFNAALKGGFKSNFQLTGDALKALVTAGVSTEAQFDQLRRASGRASLSNTQLANLVNKNSLSFMLYGPRFAKAAQEAEKLGISLASVQGAQESMVMNLDGTLDTLNQLNQLGANIDFGTLTRLNETGGPEATLKYLQSTLPPALFQSASTRGLLKGLGISVEDLMKKQGSVQDQAANNIEASLTELKKPIDDLTNALTFITAKFKALSETYGGTIKGTLLVIGSLYALYKGLGLVNGIIALSKALVNKQMGTTIFQNVVGAGAGVTSAAGATAAAGAAGAAGGAGGGGAAAGASFMQSIDAKKLVAGAAAMLIAAAALYVTAKAVQEFMKVDWKAMAMAGVALAGLVGAVAILGTITQTAGPVILMGAAAMVVIGGALYVVAQALKVAGEGMATFAPAFSTFGTTLSTLDIGKLYKFGPAAASFGIGLGVLYIASKLASSELGALADRVNTIGQSSTAIQTLATSFNTLADALDRIGEVDTSKLKDIGKLASSVPPAARTTTVAAGGARAGDNGELIQKVDELIRTLKDAKTVINIDNRVQEAPRVAMAGVNLRNDRG